MFHQSSPEVGIPRNKILSTQRIPGRAGEHSFSEIQLVVHGGAIGPLFKSIKWTVLFSAQRPENAASYIGSDGID